MLRKQKPEGGAAGGSSKQTTSILYRLDLESTRLVRIAKARHYQALAVSPSGRFVAVASGKKLIVWSDGTTLRKFEHDQEITTVDFHPTASYLAYGDNLGRISLLYYMTGGAGADGHHTPLTSTLHWHSHRVAALKFTADGEQLLSGGEESVLVVWHLQSRQKSFLPRLGAEIGSLQLSPDGQLYAVGLVDNSVKVVAAANLAIKQTVEGMRFVNVQVNVRRRPTRMAYEPHRNQLAFFGPRFVQFWSLDQNAHAGDVEVTPRNRISRTETKELVDAEVTHAAFSGDATWMATVDVRDDKEFPVDIYLKFWEWDASSQSWTLNTRIDFPHGSGRVSSLAFNPTRGATTLVTTGEDKQFRVWTLRSAGVTEGEGETTFWACAATGDYKGRTCKSVSFSLDGSLFSVAHDEQVTLWDSTSLALRTVLSHPSTSSTLSGALFCGRGSRYLVGWSRQQVHVWDLLSCSLVRNLDVVADGISTDPYNDRFAVLGRRRVEGSGRDIGMLYIYETKGTAPAIEHEMASGLRAVDFVKPKGDGNVHLVALDRTGSVHSLRERMGEAAAAATLQELAEATNKASLEFKAPKLFSALAGRVVGTAGTEGDQGATSLLAHNTQALRSNGAELLDVPNYLLPGLASIFDTFASGLISLRPIDPVLPSFSSSSSSGDVDQGSAREQKERRSNGVAGANGPVDVEMDDVSAEEDDYSFLNDLFHRQKIKGDGPSETGKGSRKKKS